MQNFIRRATSRKFLFGLSGLLLYLAGTSDVITVTTEQDLISGGIALAGIIGIGLEDIFKAWRK